MSFRIGILGVRGIGFFHARIFKHLGHQVSAILGSSKLTTEKAVENLKKTYGINAKAFTQLDDLLLKNNPDLLSICTPTQLHFEHLVKILEYQKPVFCEKPLFWHKNISYDEVMRMIDHLNSYSKLILHVNTSNANFIKSIRCRIPKKNSIKTFYFEFNTNGSSRGKEIAPDLLPHGISMLIELFGICQIANMEKRVSNNRFSCKFNYGDISVTFNFSVGSKIRKKLLFSINDNQFLRIQKITGATNYEVGLKDLKYGDVIDVEDPFQAYIKRFILACQNNDIENRDKTEVALFNMELMAHILLQK